MTDINLKDFDKNNWDEFVHLRALKDVIDQDNVINNEQNQQITQNTNDVTAAKQEAEGAKQTADEAKQNASSAAQLANMAMQSATQANTNAQNAETVAGKAQDTATQLGSQVSQLDKTVIKKTDDSTLTDYNATLLDYTNHININLYPVKTNTNDLYIWDGGYTIQVDSSKLPELNNSIITINKSIPDKCFENNSLNVFINITPANNNASTTLFVPSVFQRVSDTELRVLISNWNDHVLNNIKEFTGTVSLKFIFTGIF